ncbi:MAG: 1-acyl-sn-glycerol-3-phosphate acyltransferase [Oscillospiraceae bacterium]|nr:1-acyl-sn-glycerol-3-phosphate acyltransferase [Oscillospiraceae bacterium]
MAKKIIYYKDALHDDFAGNDIQAKTIPADFPFAIRNPFWRILEFLVYRVLATPLVWLIGKIGFGLKVKNRRALRQLRGRGYFLYGNHTQTMMDAYTPTIATFPRHAHIVTGPEAVSIPFIRRFVQLLGAIPLPGTMKGYRPFLEALHWRIQQKRVVTIYPEAHIWPWYTGVRPFPDSSFAYPVREDAPVVAFATTFRKRKVFKNLWPCLTVTLSEPFYPDQQLTAHEARKKLRDEVYDFMCSTAADPDNFAYYEYRQMTEADANE